MQRARRVVLTVGLGLVAALSVLYLAAFFDLPLAREAGGVALAQAAECRPDGDVQFVCGQRAPEDMVALPGGQWVVASAFSGAGGLSLIRTADRTSTLVFPSASTRVQPDKKTYATCPGPLDSSGKTPLPTHGLSLRPGTNGVHRLFVVLHGARESVEIFEIDARPATPAFTWIGCAVAPDPIGLNSVRWLADGGFIASNFLARGVDAAGRSGMMGGQKNGELWEWHTASGWQKVPGSEAAGANGLELSEDGVFYVAAWGSQSFFRFSRAQAGKRDEVPLGFRVDNIRWAADGTLLAAGQGGQPGSQATVIVKIDPKTMAVREVLRRPDGPSFRAGTVAVEVGKQLWVGSYQGDRIAIFNAL